jgi:hypothetical protein
MQHIMHRSSLPHSLGYSQPHFFMLQVNERALFTDDNLSWYIFLETPLQARCGPESG